MVKTFWRKFCRFWTTGTGVGCAVILCGIAIMVGLAAPNVARALRHAKVARATSDINAVDKAVTGLLADAGRRDLNDLFETYPGKNRVITNAAEANAALKELVPLQTRAMYELLRNGRNAKLPEGFTIDDGVRLKLGPHYIDLGNDPWGNPYQFYIGPWSADAPNTVAMRSRVQNPTALH